METESEALSAGSSLAEREREDRGESGPSPHSQTPGGKRLFPKDPLPRSMALVRDIGHVILQVGDMEEALRFYRDALGFRVQGEVNPVWTVVETDGGAFTLFRRERPVPCELPGEESPFNLHVPRFEAAADALQAAGYPVHRHGDHQGYVRDPWGNLLWLHDHEGEE